jgi:hypothetical protein
MSQFQAFGRSSVVFGLVLCMCHVVPGGGLHKQLAALRQQMVSGRPYMGSLLCVTKASRMVGQPAELLQAYQGQVCSMDGLVKERSMKAPICFVVLIMTGCHHGSS